MTIVNTYQNIITDINQIIFHPSHIFCLVLLTFTFFFIHHVPPHFYKSSWNVSRLANEAAALAAQLGVSTASLTSQLGRLSEMQQLALETKTQEFLGGNFGVGPSESRDIHRGIEAVKYDEM